MPFSFDGVGTERVVLTHLDDLNLFDRKIGDRRIFDRNSAGRRADKDSGRCRSKQGQRRFTQPTLAGGGVMRDRMILFK